ncbi:MAG: 3-isopropylmalate dehydratase small subunit [Armatimonadota bacterium]
MEPFVSHTGRIAVLNEDDVDTDRIIPARFLTLVTRSGYGELLFKDVRSESFSLDQPEAQGASILVVGSNFGCGSSREHAVWAIQQAGFKAVIGRRTVQTTGFSDIFRQNAVNNGLLLIELPEQHHCRFVEAGSGATAEIDLPSQTVHLGDWSAQFEINEATKEALLKGLDLIGTTLLHEDAITRYETDRGPWVPPSAK